MMVLLCVNGIRNDYISFVYWAMLCARELLKAKVLIILRQDKVEQN